jgi:polyisoprenoid-binding protein YceI
MYIHTFAISLIKTKDKMKKLALTLSMAAFALTTFAGGPAKKEAKINTEESKLQWIGEKVTGTHNGIVKIEEGMLEVADGNLTGGTVKVDMRTIEVHDLEGEYKGKLEGHLKSEDFFSAEKHQYVTFKIKKSVEKDLEDGNTHMVTGDLTIKGITKEISFPARITMEEGTLKAYASFELDRTRWKIKYGSGSFFDDLGDKTIYDDFQVKFNITASM